MGQLSAVLRRDAFCLRGSLTLNCFSRKLNYCYMKQCVVSVAVRCFKLLSQQRHRLACELGVVLLLQMLII
uniref:Uncharacterized protein n=1 Tax=Pararge aegeria TaxID=116150 RepID=S4PW96_9NEOP